MEKIALEVKYAELYTLFKYNKCSCKTDRYNPIELSGEIHTKEDLSVSRVDKIDKKNKFIQVILSPRDMLRFFKIERIDVDNITIILKKGI